MMKHMPILNVDKRDGVVEVYVMLGHVRMDVRPHTAYYTWQELGYCTVVLTEYYELREPDMYINTVACTRLGWMRPIVSTDPDCLSEHDAALLADVVEEITKSEYMIYGHADVLSYLKRNLPACCRIVQLDHRDIDILAGDVRVAEIRRVHA